MTDPAPLEAVESVASRESSGSGESMARWSDKTDDLRSRWFHKDVVVNGKNVPLEGYEPVTGVVEVASLTVVPSAPTAIREMRERVVGHGVPTGLRAQLVRGWSVGSRVEGRERKLSRRIVEEGWRWKKDGRGYERVGGGRGVEVDDWNVGMGLR